MLRKFTLGCAAVGLAAMVLLLLFAAFMQLYLLNSYPPGLDPDAAAYGLNALKPLRYGFLPFYDYNNGSAEPMFIYSASVAVFLFGPTRFALKLLSAFFGIASLAMLYASLCELGRTEFKAETRRAIALLAVAALATSQVVAFLFRFGMRFSTSNVFQMAAVWALARAARTGKRSAWVLAGCLAAVTQYTYLSSRVLPLLLLLVLLLKLPPRWWKDKQVWGGLSAFGLGGLVLLVPQIVWYARYPATFLSRTSQTGITQNPMYAQLGLAGTVLDKLNKYWLALGWVWNGQYNQIKEPLLAPLFFYGFVAGLVVSVVYFRRRFALILLCGIAVMVLPDLLAGDRDWPHETRIIGVFPFVAALSGLGIATVLEWLTPWRNLKRVAVVLLCAAIGFYMHAQVAEFFGAEKNLGRMHWGGNTQLRRVDAGVAELIVTDEQSYLVPLSNYADAVIKYLTSKRALQVRSAVDAQGALLPVLRQGRATLVLPLADDGQPWRGNPTQWVLFEGDAAYVLPPRMDLTVLFPVLDDASVIFGKGIDDNVRLGHIVSVDARQVVKQLVPAAAFPQAACFNNGICLKAVGYSRATLVAGESFEVDLHWTVQHALTDDYIMFVHLLDHTGQAVAGVNAYPLEHAYRTYEWKPGETIITSTVLDIPASVRAGAYSFELGMYSPFDFERIPTVDAGNLVNGDRILFGPVKRPRPAVKLPADSVPVKIGLGDELELIGYRIDALPTGSQALQLTLWWRGVRPATEDWTAFFHVTPSANNAELVGQLDHAITDHEYPPTVWAAGEVVQEQVQISAAKLQPGSYAVWMGMYAPVTQMRAAIKAGPGVVVDNRALLLEFQLAP